MESSLFAHPGFIVPTVLGLIGFIAWLIRLESRLGSVDKAAAKVEVSLDELWREFEHHKANTEIHFNKRLADEVERRHNENMVRMQADISEIKTMVKELKSTL